MPYMLLKLENLELLLAIKDLLQGLQKTGHGIF